MAKEYTELRSNGPETETLVTLPGYTAYSINGEYAFAKDMTVQGYYGWAKEAERMITDQAAENNGSDMTELGVNVIKKIADHTITGGLAVSKRLEQDAVGSAKGSIVDNTQAYVGYALAL